MARRYDNQGRDQFNIENARDVYVGEARSRKRPDREMTWLKAFEKEVEGRLATSLHNQILINLGKQAQPEQVHRLWDMEIKSGQITETISPEMPIVEVFDRPTIAGKLLILGKPGAGKTTTLLELARALVWRAIDDASEPMPFLLNLSSWKDPKQSIQDWAIAELTTKGIGSKLGAKWIADQKVLPLLDGLDEVRSDLQPACVTAINQFLGREEQPISIVVCSRREEYELYPEQLNLNGAIYLQELSDEQIEGYLKETNRSDLLQILSIDSELLELVRQPLLLSMALVAYRKELGQLWQTLESTHERLDFLLNAYIEQMLYKPINSRMYDAEKEPTKEEMEWWLIVLAYQLYQESQTEFLIEKMQLYWLSTRRQQQAYNISYAIISGIIGGIISTLISQVVTIIFITFLGKTLWQILNVAPRWSWLIPPLIGLLFGAVLGLNDGKNTLLKDEKIEIVERLQWSWTAFNNKVFSELGKGISDGLLYGFLLGLIWGLILGIEQGKFEGLLLGVGQGLFERLVLILKSSFFSALIGSFTIGLARGLTTGLFGGLISGLRGIEVDIKREPNQGIWRSASNCAISAILGICVGLVITFSCGLLANLTRQIILNSYQQSISNSFENSLTDRLIIALGLIVLLISSLTFGLFFGLRGGGRACIQHLSLRLVLFLSDYAPWNYACFLNYATERMFLQRIGGRYRFIHKLLQDHFAAMSDL